MKKIINLLLLSIVAFAFFGCNQPTGPSEEELQKQREEQDTLLEDAEVTEQEEPKKVPKKDQISLEEIDDRLMTIDDFLK